MYKDLKTNFFNELNEAKALDFKKANEKVDAKEACFYEDMRDILNNPRQTLNYLDKYQMYEIVDKQLNNLHKLDLNKECEIE